MTTTTRNEPRIKAIREARREIRNQAAIHVVPAGERHMTYGLECECKPYRDRLESQVIVHRNLSHD